jgi:hypothetical protein
VPGREGADLMAARMRRFASCGAADDERGNANQPPCGGRFFILDDGRWRPKRNLL